MTLLHEVHQVLSNAGIDHALIGALAMSRHGFVRATVDADLLACTSAALDPALWASLRSSGVEIEVRRGDDSDPLLGVVVARRGDEKVDLVIGRGRWQIEVVRRATGDDVPVVTLVDLVLLKLDAGGNTDRSDVERMVRPMSAEQIAKVEAGLHHLSDWSRGHWERIKQRLAEDE